LCAGQAGDFFFSHGQYEKAVHLFISAKQYMKALTLCMKHNVKITESMAERMTPAKTKDEAEKVTHRGAQTRTRRQIETIRAGSHLRSVPIHVRLPLPVDLPARCSRTSDRNNARRFSRSSLTGTPKTPQQQTTTSERSPSSDGIRPQRPAGCERLLTSPFLFLLLFFFCSFVLASFSCKDQGEYHLACKKYTQSGDHVRAMKCLLKSSDTEKICYYATMTKQREIYILAANYLQNLDWHNDPEIMKKIIDFYSKVTLTASGIGRGGWMDASAAG